MTAPSPSAHDVAWLALRVGSWICAGSVIGLLHFAGLRWNVAALTGGRPAVLGAMARLTVTAAALLLIVRGFGALPLLAAAAGMLLARTIAIRWSAIS